MSVTSSFTALRLDPFEDVCEDVRLGKPVVIVDDVDRENEGDLMVAAELATAESINFMIREGRGLICLSLTKERLEELDIRAQVADNQTALGTNFTVSIDHVSVADAPITAQARAKTMRETVNEAARPSDFKSPGFVFPLGAASGGVLQRVGQTEGSVDLSRIAGLKPAGVICEIMGDGGHMLAGEELAAYCKEHDLKITSVEAIAQWRIENEMRLVRKAQCELPDIGRLRNMTAKRPEIRAFSYLDESDGREQLAIVFGQPENDCLVRIHSECLTGDIFGSRRCDCGDQLEMALEAMAESGSGVLVYLQQEGRGIGLGNKLRAYELQDSGLDTVEANIELGFDVDMRDYRAGAMILLDLELTQVRLITNNPDKVSSLESFGVRVVEKVGSWAPVSKDNVRYLAAKAERLGHSIDIPAGFEEI